MMRPIAPGLSPNLEKRDAYLAFSLLCRPWNYNRGVEIKKLEKWFEKTYDAYAFSFISARGGLYAILKSLNIKKNDEVLVEGFTCVAVVDAILATGARPVYIDIQKNFVIDAKDVIAKTTMKTKAIVLQHTFGIPGGSRELAAFVKKNNIFLIEDVAHGIGISDGKELLGREGIAAIFSFGRDKAFSSVSGGMVITHDKNLADLLQKFQKGQEFPSLLTTFQNLFHMVSFYFFILPFYDIFGIGKVLLVIFQKSFLLGKPIDVDELSHFARYTRKFPNALAAVALSQIKKLKEFNNKRMLYTKFYQDHIGNEHFSNAYDSLPLLRFPLFIDDPQKLKKIAKKKHVYLGDWYSNGIDPKGTNLKEIFYKKGSCPTAEKITNHIINLPTYPTLTIAQARKVVTIVSAYVNDQANNT